MTPYRNNRPLIDHKRAFTKCDHRFIQGIIGAKTFVQCVTCQRVIHNSKFKFIVSGNNVI